MSRFVLHNAQAVLELCQDEDYVHHKEAYSFYTRLIEEISDVQDAAIDSEYLEKNKKLRRKELSRLKRIKSLLREMGAIYWGLKYEKEKQIIRNALAQPIAPRKVDLLVSQNADSMIEPSEEYCFGGIKKQGSSKR